jgi:hypothetical protein
MYPDESLQFLIPPWWQKEDSQDIKRGRLLKAFVPHVDQNPMILIPEGRKESTSHTQVNYRLEPLQIKQIPKAPTLPVAALPAYPREIRTVYRAKKRPVLIISCGGPDIPKLLGLALLNGKQLLLYWSHPIMGQSSLGPEEVGRKNLLRESGDVNIHNTFGTNYP